MSFSKPLPLHSLSVLLRLIFLLQCLLDRSLVALESNIAEASRRNRKNEYRIQMMAITDPSPTRSLKMPRRSPDFKGATRHPTDQCLRDSGSTATIVWMWRENRSGVAHRFLASAFPGLVGAAPWRAGVAYERNTSS